VTDNLTLGVEALDGTHDEFLVLLDAAKAAQGSRLLACFAALIEHTEAHFEMEEALMREHAFYGMQEHLDEHENLLNEMRHFFDRAQKLPPFGRAYIDDYAYEKFRRHIINIDSQLAMFLKSKTEALHA
jgi:hemerythrin